MQAAGLRPEKHPPHFAVAVEFLAPQYALAGAE